MTAIATKKKLKQKYSLELFSCVKLSNDEKRKFAAHYFHLWQLTSETNISLTLYQNEECFSRGKKNNKNEILIYLFASPNFWHFFFFHSIIFFFIWLVNRVIEIGARRFMLSDSDKHKHFPLVHVSYKKANNGYDWGRSSSKNIWILLYRSNAKKKERNRKNKMKDLFALCFFFSLLFMHSF